MYNVKRIPNFIDEKEKNLLIDWIESNKHRFFDANMGGSRVTTRYFSHVPFPMVAHEIRKRIVKVLSIDDMDRPPFAGGMVASYAPVGDSCYSHIDPIWHEGKSTLHCNIILQKPTSGGILYIQGEEFIVDESELFCYLVSDYSHGVSEIQGDKARLLWVFGFCVDKETYLNENL